MGTVTNEEEVDTEMPSLLRRYGRTALFIMVIISIELAILVSRGWHL